MNEQQDTELNRFINRLSSGETSTEEIAEWEERLKGDRVLRRSYRSRMRMEANLLSILEVERPDLIPPLMSEPHSRLRRRWWLLSGGVGIAAALVLGFFLGSGKEPSPAKPIVAHLESQSEAAWSGTLPVVSGGSLHAGTLELRSGLAEL
ncbi:MAG TPA: hypothetical protein VJ952_06405, partial [Opitutales bacterium]|nr:hypothetical protein [Opitutales bacterium]